MAPVIAATTSPRGVVRRFAPSTPGSVRRSVASAWAYDGSPEAELALEAAYALAARLDAAVSLYLAVLPGATLDLASQHTRRDAGALLDAAAGRAPEDVNPETVVLTGYASEEISRHVATASISSCSARVDRALWPTRSWAARRTRPRSRSGAPC